MGLVEQSAVDVWRVRHCSKLAVGRNEAGGSGRSWCVCVLYVLVKAVAVLVDFGARQAWIGV